MNKKYSRTGILFQGRTKNKIIHDEYAFPYLAKYILLNPVKAKLCNTFEEYEYSSAKELLGLTKMNITNNNILAYFSGVNEFKRFINATDEDDSLHGLDIFV